jgi:hypothetical protein
VRCRSGLGPCATHSSLMGRSTGAVLKEEEGR